MQGPGPLAPLNGFRYLLSFGFLTGADHEKYRSSQTRLAAANLLGTDPRQPRRRRDRARRGRQSDFFQRSFGDPHRHFVGRRARTNAGKNFQARALAGRADQAELMRRATGAPAPRGILSAAGGKKFPSVPRSRRCRIATAISSAPSCCCAISNAAKNWKKI